MTFNSLNDMSNFLVSARKYRPVNFKDVVGQETITTTLKNAITNNKLAQALLFTGPRGVGKTSCARIVAREINVKNMVLMIKPSKSRKMEKYVLKPKTVKFYLHTM